MEKETRQCQNCKNDFTIEAEDFAFYERLKVPPPTFCPMCRFKRRMAWRNERVFFRRKNDVTGKEMIAGFPASVPFPVYDRDYWWSDAWDPITYGRDYDFSKSFFQQFRDLMNFVPWSGRSVINVVNSDYSDQASQIKNCYLCFNVDYLENCAYVVRANNLKDSYDMLHAQFSELCYESAMISKDFRVFFSLDCESSTDLWFSKNCMGCSNCFGCVNLRKKSYHIWNQPYSREEYFRKLKEFNLGSYKSIAEIKKQAREFWSKFPVKFLHGIRNFNSTGDMLGDTKNVRNSYSIQEGENLKHCQYLYLKSTDSYDHTVWGNRSSQTYECLTCGEEIDNLKFCFDCWPSLRGLEYCISCHSSSDCFGCVGLKKKQYCIFNKQYSKEDYFALREKIIAQMKELSYKDAKGRVYSYGEFFPEEFSPFAYNETMLQDAFPLTKEEAAKQGYSWRDPELKEYETTIKADDLPDHIKYANDEILKEIIKCSACDRAYRIVIPELNFLRRIGLPLPRTCPNCRTAERFKLINPPQFSKRNCQCSGEADESSVYKNTASHFHGQEHCPNDFETAYPKERPDIIYCEQCYQAEVV